MTQLQTLQTLQAQFQQALLQDQPMAPQLLGARGIAQFGVYRIAYRARLRSPLRDNFEELPRVMGDESFDALANAYLNAHPSQHYSLRWFGHQLCDFMAANLALVEHPALLDLARMEWALRHAFDAAPAALLSFEALTAVPAAEWAELRFRLHPSVQLLDLHWAVGPLWHALKATPEDVNPPDALEHCVLVWRLGMTAQWKSLAPVEIDFVKGLLAHCDFSHLCALLAEHVGEEQAAASAVSVLRELLANGAICELATP